MTSVKAVYENGVFRPTEPVALADGQAVRLTVDEASQPAVEPLSPEMAAYEARLKAATTLAELFEAFDTAPDDPNSDFDIVAAVNQTRRETGFRLPDPEPRTGGAE